MKEGKGREGKENENEKWREDRKKQKEGKEHGRKSDLRLKRGKSGGK